MWEAAWALVEVGGKVTRLDERVARGVGVKTLDRVCGVRLPPVPRARESDLTARGIME